MVFRNRYNLVCSGGARLSLLNSFKDLLEECGLGSAWSSLDEAKREPWHSTYLTRVLCIARAAVFGLRVHKSLCWINLSTVFGLLVRALPPIK